MANKEKKLYAPHQRGYFELKPKIIKAYSVSGKDYSELPDPVSDPIVTNDIANVEFNYTFNCDDDI